MNFPILMVFPSVARALEASADAPQAVAGTVLKEAAFFALVVLQAV